MTKSFLALLATALFLATGCAKGSAEVEEVRVNAKASGGLHETLFVATSTLWPEPGNIPVCWEQSGFTQQKAWVKDAVHKAWEMNDSAIKFTGWGPCTDGAPGIHIVSRLDAENGPHVANAFGRELDGMKDGMVLDLDMENEMFSNCHTEEMLEQCNRGVAVHEFGHALGFLHEHERSDTPTSCPDRNPFEPGESDKTTGKWDLMSIMNYCFPDRMEVYPDGLSDLDKVGLIQMYPPPKVTSPATPGDDDDDTGPKTQSTDEDDSITGDDDDAASDDDKKSSSKKKSTSRASSASLASSGCSSAPGSAPPSSALGWLLGFGLVLAARRRR